MILMHSDSKKYNKIMELNVLCVQILPIHFQPAQTMEKVSKMLEEYSNIDIVVLPEMAFTGYTFTSREEIYPLLEEPNSSYPTFNWCSEQARRLGAYIFCGYPEKHGNNAYNSMMVVSPQGEFVENCRKNFLYYIDEAWSLEGGIFKSTEITKNGRNIKVGLGICMDINPYQFKAPFEKYELANFWKESDVDLCVFCTNWTSGGLDDTSQGLISYWLSRLKPLLEGKKNRYFLAADRIGEERGTRYMGTSCVIKLCKRYKVLEYLNISSEKVLYYKLTL